MNSEKHKRLLKAWSRDGVVSSGDCEGDMIDYWLEIVEHLPTSAKEADVNRTGFHTPCVWYDREQNVMVIDIPSARGVLRCWAREESIAV